MDYENIRDKEFLDAGFASKFLSHTKKLNINSDIASRFYRYICSGENKVYHKLNSVAITVDDSWINTIENCLYYIENVVRNPKKFIKEEQYLVNVEKAKRVGPIAVKYLSSHTMDVNSVDKDGFVIPKRIMSSEFDEDLAIYENRFVCTLINRLVQFVEERDREINGQLQVFDRTTIYLNSSFTCGKTDFKCKMQLEAQEPPINSVQKVMLEKNEAIQSKIINVRKRLQIIKNTPFIKYLNTLKPVRSPINKTNILKMNVDYRNCYELWIFISAYRFTGLSADVAEKDLPVSNDYFDDLAYLSAISFKQMVDNEMLHKELYDSIELSPYQKRKYKIIRQIKADTTFEKGKTKNDDDTLINEYFYNQMLEEFKKSVNYSKGNVLLDDYQLKLSFARFYHAVTNISNQMYDELISRQSKKSVIKRSALQKKEDAVNEQRITYKRMLQLSKLKAEEYEKTLKKANKENLKLQQLINEYNDLQAKTARKDVKQAMRQIKNLDTSEKLEDLRDAEDALNFENEEILEESKNKSEKSVKKLERSVKRGVNILTKILGEAPDFVSKKDKKDNYKIGYDDGYKAAMANSVGAFEQNDDNLGDVESLIKAGALETGMNENDVLATGEKNGYISYKRSFSSKFIQASPEIQNKYAILKNYIATFKGIRNRICWEYESFNYKRQPMLRIVLKAKSMNLYFNLKPEDYVESKYKIVSVADKKKYEKLPCKFTVKSDKSLTLAKELIAQMLSGLKTQEVETVDYKLPYQDTQSLIDRGLIKRVISKRNFIEFLRQQQQKSK